MSMAIPGRWATTVAAILAVAGPAHAWGSASSRSDDVRTAAQSSAERPVLMAQAGDALQRINQLEEDNRQLTGRVEELSFQLLQLQEQLRKLQEDNEFRFQELEGGTAGASGAGRRTEGSAPSSPPAAGSGSGDADLAAAAPPRAASDPVASSPGSAAPDTAGKGDAIGELLGDTGLDTSGLGTTSPVTPGSSDTVAVVTPNGPSEMYDLAYNYLLAGDYQLAENSFRQYAQTYPDAADVPDARYWLGESLYAQAKYADAAEVFLNAQKDNPKSGKAPEMMLKLGMSLAKLDNRETACVTFKEVTRRYPQVSANVKRKLDAETKSAGC